MPPEPDADLRWTAFLYVAGELPTAKEAEFERRLDDDQAAREAVAEAVELAGALASVGPGAFEPARTRGPSARRALAWSAMAAAASLAVATAWAIRSSRTSPPDASEVAIAWSGLRSHEPIGGEVDFVSPPDEPHPASELDAPTDPALPSWLLTAAEARDDAPIEEN